MKTRSNLPLLYLVHACVITAVLAVSGASQAGPYNKPIYNPETKTYFELFNPSVKKSGAARASATAAWRFTWEEAEAFAKSRSHNGVRGRLAVVETAETHEFLARRFDLGEPAWIGLRYWCAFRKLQWVTGEIHPLTGFRRWARPWNLIGDDPRAKPRTAVCNDMRRDSYLPVHYWPTGKGFEWNANSRGQKLSTMFIEYPTGKP